MATVDSKEFVDNVIKHNGFYNGDDEDAPDNPRCIKIVEYTNMGGAQAWGLIFQGERLNRYDASPYITDSKTIWEYKG